MSAHHQQEEVPTVLRVEVAPNEFVCVWQAVLAGPPTVAVWMFVSQGLARSGQREITLAISRSPRDEMPPRSIFLYYRTIFDLSKQGQHCDHGGYSSFASPLLLGRHCQFYGIFYCEDVRRCLPTLTAGQRPLVGVLVTLEEVQTGLRLGSYRILSRLGEVANFCPFPTWTDLERQPVALVERLENTSLLAQLPCLTLPVEAAPHVAYLPPHKRLEIAFDPQGRDALRRRLEQVPVGAAHALFSLPALGLQRSYFWFPGADSQLTAVPGQPDNVRSGNFVALVPTAKQSEVLLAEDGFLLMLAEHDAQQLRSALLDGRPFRLPPAVRDKTELVVVWRQRSYVDPFERTHSDDVQLARPPPGSASHPFERILLLPPAHYGVAAARLASYCTALIETVRGVFAPPPLQSTDNPKLTVRVSLVPSGAALIAIDPTSLQELLPRLEQIVAPPVSTIITFAVEFEYSHDTASSSS